jgi:hypothetical protein
MHSEQGQLSSECREAWESLSSSELQENPTRGIIVDLATRLKLFVCDADVASLVPVAGEDSWIGQSWALHATDLIGALNHPFSQQLVLAALLPDTTYLRSLIVTTDAALRMRVIHDALANLLQLLGPGPILLGAAYETKKSQSSSKTGGISRLQWEGRPRPALLATLIVMEQQLAYYTPIPHTPLALLASELSITELLTAYLDDGRPLQTHRCWLSLYS